MPGHRRSTQGEHARHSGVEEMQNGFVSSYPRTESEASVGVYS